MGMLTLEQIATAVDGRLSGNPSQEVHGVASLGKAGPRDIAPLESSRFDAMAKDSKAGALLVARRSEAEWGVPTIAVDHPLAALNRVIELLGLVRKGKPGIHATAAVDSGAFIHRSVSIGPYAVVESGARVGARTVLGAHVVVEKGVVLGEDCRVAASAVLHEGLVAGDRVRIGAHSVLAGPGFAYAPGPAGAVRLHHIGTVVLEDDVHIGAGATIDRARFDETRIGRQTALDNQVHVGHNATIGARTFIAAQCGLAGRAHIGDDCEVGGQAGFGTGCGVGDRCRVAGGAGLTRSFGDDEAVMWYPGFERTEAWRMIAHLRKAVQRRASKRGV